MQIQPAKIKDFSNQCFTSLGMPEEEANIITEALLEADLREIHSHGFMRLPIYVERMQKGLIETKANISYEMDSSSLALMDAGYSAGQVAGCYAMEKAIEKAGKSGVGIVAVKNSNHFGITAFYSLMAAKKDMIGIALSNVAPLMPAIGGAEKVIGNNPLSIAAPTQTEFPIVADMAMSNTSFGKVLYAKEKREEIPHGWGVNAKGVPTTNPDEVINGGFLSPVGGPKGFGLALMIEILTGILSGGAFSKMIPSMYDVNQKQSISHFMMAIDIKKLIPLDLYYQNINQLVSYIKQSKKAEGVSEIYLPGEIEFLKERRNKEKGVHMEEDTFASLTKLADQLGLSGLAVSETTR
jgi:LDH2 family malate/lactate/ureidoglycolate dehydrogenase